MAEEWHGQGMGRHAMCGLAFKGPLCKDHFTWSSVYRLLLEEMCRLLSTYSHENSKLGL